jgi:hypothetical protein
MVIAILVTGFYLFIGFLLALIGPPDSSSSFWKVMFLWGVRPFVTFEKWIKISDRKEFHEKKN